MNDATVFLHLAFRSHGLDKHSLTSRQTPLSSTNPSIQLHLKEPTVLTQIEVEEQTSSALHSSMSSQFTPSPLNPAKHSHSNDPSVLLQFALVEQLSLPIWHSSVSKQLSPSPEYPSLQPQLKPPK